MKALWFFCFILSTFAVANPRGDGPQLNRGQLDLAHWQNDLLIVQGQWLVLPDQLIHAGNYKTYDIPQLLEQPDAQFQESNGLFSPSTLPNFQGFHASYIMLIKNPRPQSLGIHVAGYKNDYETFVYVPDTDFFYRLDGFGQPYADRAIVMPYATPAQFYNLDALGMMGRDFYLIVNSRGVHMNDGSNGLGMSTLKLGTSAAIDRIELAQRVEQFILLGVYAMLMIYSLAIYILRREDRSSLTVGLLSLFLALRYVSTERLFLMSPSLYSMGPYLFTLMTIFHSAAAGAVIVFMMQKFHQYFSRKIFKLGLFAVALGATNLISLVYWNPLLASLATVLFLMIFTFIIIPYSVYVGWKAKHIGGIYSSVSLLFFSLAMLNDSYHATLGSLDPLWLGHYGMLSLAIGFALVNAKIFANTYQKSVELNDSLEIKNKEITYFNRNLERLVADKTQEITALLDHIPQGVLSLEIGGIISKDFSRHLTDIIDEQPIAGRSFKELVLERSNLNADQRDQAWQTLQVVIGEADLNFDANIDKLPDEFSYQTKQGIKWLKATWNVEVQDTIVQRLLVTLLDVSKEKGLEKEAEEQRQEFEIIRELVDAGVQKISQYFVSATALLNENKKILEKPASGIDHSDIQCMFINMHTIKGGARTLGLKDLARVLHEAEEYYQDILRHGREIRKDHLLSDMLRALSVYDHYQQVNKNKLNRSEDYSKLIVDRDFIESHYQILGNIVSDLDRKDKAFDGIIQRIHAQKETLIRLIFDQLPAVFDEYRLKAEKIAQEVEKPKPQLDFMLDDISITPEMKSMLDNCMVHLLRNALCHGIESPEERLMAGKPEVGTITINSHLQNNTLHLELFDDGRGLAIEKLRQKGRELGQLPETATVQEVAELIFAAGVSTASTVTHISGRGVGMDAVRKFLEQQGGGIEVRLGNPKDDSRRFHSFKFLIHIPLQKTTSRPSLVSKIA